MIESEHSGITVEKILRCLKDNGYNVGEPLVLDRANDKTFLGKIWQSATRNRDDRLFVLIFDKDTNQILCVESNRFEFSVRGGFTSAQLLKLAFALAKADIRVHKVQKRRGLLPFYHIYEDTTWKLKSGGTLRLGTFEDKDYVVKPNEVKNLRY